MYKRASIQDYERVEALIEYSPEFLNSLRDAKKLYLLA
jgi:hypothetical protein